MYSYTTTGTYSLCVEVVEAVGVGFRFRVWFGLVFYQIRVRVHWVKLRYGGRKQREVVCLCHMSTAGVWEVSGVVSAIGTLQLFFRGKWGVRHTQVLCEGGRGGF